MNARIPLSAEPAEQRSIERQARNPFTVYAVRKPFKAALETFRAGCAPLDDDAVRLGELQASVAFATEKAR